MTSGGSGGVGGKGGANDTTVNILVIHIYIFRKRSGLVAALGSLYNSWKHVEL